MNSNKKKLKKGIYYDFFYFGEKNNPLQKW